MARGRRIHKRTHPGKVWLYPSKRYAEITGDHSALRIHRSKPLPSPWKLAR